MQEYQPKTEQKRRRLLFFGLFGLVLFMAFLMTMPEMFLRQTVVVKILDVDAPVSCRSSGFLFGGPKSRSAAPKGSPFYCGHVSTDHGSLMLPESHRFMTGETSREQMIRTIAIGRCYEVTLFGYGGDVAQRRGISNRGKRNIRNLKPASNC